MHLEIQPNIDNPLMKEIQAHVQIYFQCQTCTAGCPVFKALPDFKPSTIAQHLAREGTVPYIDELPAYWICAGCYSCETKCPQDVDLAHIFFKLKNWAVENNGPVPKGIIDEASMMKTGITVPLTQSILNRREKLGLPEIPKPDIEEIEKVLKATKFSDKLDNLLKTEVTK